MFYTILALAIILALVFWWTQKQAKKQQEWRRQKELEIMKKRARLTARQKADPKNSNEEE